MWTEEHVLLAGLNRVKLTSLALDYAFSDVIFLRTDNEKYELRKKLDDNCCFMAARKLRQAVNFTLLKYRDELLKAYNRRTPVEARLLGMALMITIPEIWRVAWLHYNNVPPMLTAGQLYTITEATSVASISTKLSRFRKFHHGYIPLGKHTGIQLLMEETYGQAGNAHRMRLHEPINIKNKIPDAVVIVRPRGCNLDNINGPEFDDEIDKIRLYRRLNYPFLEVLGSSDSIIEIVKIVGFEIFSSKYFWEGSNVMMIKGSQKAIPAGIFDISGGVAQPGQSAV